MVVLDFISSDVVASRHNILLQDTFPLPGPGPLQKTLFSRFKKDKTFPLFHTTKIRWNGLATWHFW